MEVCRTLYKYTKCGISLGQKPELQRPKFSFSVLVARSFSVLLLLIRCQLHVHLFCDYKSIGTCACNGHCKTSTVFCYYFAFWLVSKSASCRWDSPDSAQRHSPPKHPAVPWEAGKWAVPRPAGQVEGGTFVWGGARGGWWRRGC